MPLSYEHLLYVSTNDVDRILGWLSFMTDQLGDWDREDEDLHRRLVAWVDQSLETEAAS